MYCVVVDTAEFAPPSGPSGQHKLVKLTALPIYGFETLASAKAAASSLELKSDYVMRRCMIFSVSSDPSLALRSGGRQVELGQRDPADRDRPNDKDRAIDDLQKSGDRYRDDRNGKNLKDAMDDYKDALDKLTKPDT